MKGHIRKRKGRRGTTYLVRVDLGPDPMTGKRRQPSKTFRTRREAEAGLAEWIAEIERGTAVDPSRMTVAEFLDYWLETYAVHNVRPTTLRSYEQLIRIHVKPVLGGVSIQKLHPTQLQQLYNAKLRDGRADGKPGGLAPRTVRAIHMVLREALQQAVKWQLVPRNVADATEPPRAPRAKIKAWDVPDVLQFLDVAASDIYSPVWLLALTTGMRRGEMLGLPWRDVDLERGVLSVSQTLVEVNGRPMFQQPKTAAGRRLIVLSPTAIDALREHRGRQLERREQLGELWRDHDLVFTTVDGGPITPSNLRRSFLKLIAKAGVQKIPFHALRHTHATMLLKDGLHAKIVSERLGHASIGITLDTYSHVLPSMQRDAADGIDRIIFGMTR